MANCWKISKFYQAPNEFEIRGMTQDNNGNFYCAGSHLFKIDKATKEAKVLKPEDGWWRAIAYHNNMLYITDKTRIITYSLETNELGVLAGTSKEGYQDGALEEAQFMWLGGLVIDKHGDLYCTVDHLVRKINLEARVVQTIAGDSSVEIGGYKDGKSSKATFDSPDGIVITNDPNPTLYVADSHNSAIRYVKDDTVHTLQFINAPINVQLLRHETLVVQQSEALHFINLKTDNHYVIKLALRLKTIFADPGGILYVVGTNYNTFILKLEPMWIWQRYLWIGHLKEDSSYCLLASLPKDIIKEIAWFCVSDFVKEAAMLEL